MRARNLKPAIYKNHELAKLGDQAFRLFTGLWCMADRKGRLKYEPEKIQAELFPFRFQDIDIDALLTLLAANDDPFLIIYAVKGVRYIEIKNFSRHQHPHPKESDSAIPPSKNKDKPRYGLGHTQDMSNRADVLIPSSLIPDVLNPDVPITPSAPDGRVKHLVDYFYKKASNPISFPGGQAGKFFKKALASMSVGLIQAYIDNWFSSTDPFVVKEAFRFGLFVTKFDALKGGPIYGRTTTTPSVRHITDDPKRTEAYRG